MSSDQIANIAYLALLGCAVAGWFFMQNRNSLGRNMQQMAVWVLIFVGVIAGVGLWQDIRRDVLGGYQVSGDNVIQVPRAMDGHYYLSLDINNVPVNFVVDTGATEMVLSQQDAAAVGLDPANLAYLGQANTANGVVRTANVWLEQVVLGPIRDTNVRALVNQGELQGSLLGMGYLGRFESIEIRAGELILTR